MTKIFFYFFVFCISINTCSAQENIPAISQATSTAIIPERIDAIEKSLKKISQTINDISFDAPAQLQKKMPVNSQNIDNKIDALSSSKVTSATKKQITKNKQLIQVIKNTSKNLVDQQNTLNKADKAIEQMTDAVTALQQLLSNPINQKNLSPEQLKKGREFKQKAKTLAIKSQQLSAKINNQKKLLDNNVELLNRWQNALARTFAVQNEISKNNLEKQHLSKEQKRYQMEAEQLQGQLSDDSNKMDLKTIEKLQKTIYQKQTMAWLKGIDMRLAELVRKQPVIKTKSHFMQKNIPISILKRELQKTNQALETLANLKTEVGNRQLELKKHIEITGAQPALEKAFSENLQSIAYQRLRFSQKPQQFKSLITTKKQSDLLTRDELFRQSLLKTSNSNIWNSFVQISYQIQISFTTLYQQVIKKPYFIVGLTLASILFIYLLGHYMVKWVSGSARQRNDKISLFSTIRKVLRKHTYFTVFMIFIVVLVKVSDVPYPSDYIISSLVYCSMALLFWLELVNIESKLGTLPKKLAKSNAFISTILTLSVLLYSLSVISSVDATLVIIYEKLLMLVMIIFTLITRKNICFYLDKEKVKISKKSYTNLLKILNSIPWIIITIGFISLIGYGRIAWLILGYLGMISIYLLTTMIGLTTINHLRKYFKLYSIRTFSHGAFIAQDIVSPLAFITKIIWLIATTQVLFVLLHWNLDSYLIAKILIILNHSLFSLSSTVVSPFIILLLLLSIYLIFRLAKWLRTFSYHWLYANINDLGIRNSLSIFTQYVTALIGILIALNVLGIDLTSLTVFAGALGVGIGLGLQDIAKNFISGILLLLERPLRTGDWVVIDGSEGIVKSIGMRAITIETFDKQEVIIPNGHAISNSFTNFTHSNTIIRTVLYVGAGYGCDPKIVITILNDILNRTDGILTEPEAKIIMWEYADSAINYRIQYYIDLEKSGLWETKTDILKAIWYDFKSNNIEIPFPQRDIHFRNILMNNNTYTSNEDNALKGATANKIKDK